MPLLTTRLSGAQHSLAQRAAPAPVRPAAPLPPQDGLPQRPLGGVVRRLDALTPHERPQLPLVGDQVTARRRRLGTPACLPVLQRLEKLAPKSADVDLEA